MIFITLGSQKFQFNRLLQAVDNQISTISEPVFAQIGYSDYHPIHFEYKNFLNRTEFVDCISRSDIVITHGGTGAIINAVKQKKKVIAVPRLSKYGEHVDDHQLQIIEQFKDSNLILACYDCDQISDLIRQAKQMEFSSYESNTERIINNIREYIQQE